MEVHFVPFRDLVYGWGFRQYNIDGKRPAMVIDETRDIRKPDGAGQALSGSFDIYYDNALYVGLAAPFIIASIPATLIRAFPSSAPIAVDYILQPGGNRSVAPADSFILGDNDLWSFGNG